MGRKVCGACRGRLVYLGRFSRDGSPAKQRRAPPSGFAAFVQQNFAAARASAAPGTPQAELMRRLGERYRAAQQAGEMAAGAEPGGGGGGGAGSVQRSGDGAVASLLGELSLAA